MATTKTNLTDKDKLCQDLQSGQGNKQQVLANKITQLEQQKTQLEKKCNDLDSEKSRIESRVVELEESKKGLDAKIKEAEKEKTDLKKKIQELDSKKGAQQQTASTGPGDKKSKEELQKLQKENKDLRKDKDDLAKTLKVIEKDLKKNINNVKPNKIPGELKKLMEKLDKNGIVLENGHHTSAPDSELTQELDNLKTNFESIQKDLEARTAEIERLTSQLTRSKTDCNSAVEKLRKSESELCQIKEKNAQLSDELLNKSRTITAFENGAKPSSSNARNDATLEAQVEDLKRKLAEMQASKPKKSVKFNTEPEVLNSATDPIARVKELEDSLNAAYKERQEIIETCRKEVDFHRTIASELEVSIMEDFEWKLHEIEKDYKEKLRHSKEKIDDQIKEACIGILKEKDEEINKLQDQVSSLVIIT